MDPLVAAFWTLFALAVVANAWLWVNGGAAAVPARVSPPPKTDSSEPVSE